MLVCVCVFAHLIGSCIFMHMEQNTPLGSDSNVQGHFQCLQPGIMSSSLSFFFLHTGSFLRLYTLIVQAPPLYPSANVRKMSHLLFSRRLSQQFEACVSVYLFVSQCIVCLSLNIRVHFNLHGICVWWCLNHFFVSSSCHLASINNCK